MFYAIIIAGVLLIVASKLLHSNLRNKLTTTKSEYQRLALASRVVAILVEWKKYAIRGKKPVGLMNLIIAAGGILLLMIINFRWLNFSSDILLPVLVVFAFWGQIYIGRALHRREFEERFPEVLATVNAAVSAGNSINQAINRCGKRVDGNLGVLFNRVDRRLNLGEDPERVLKEAWKEYKYPEFFFFNTVMLVSMQHGGQLRTLIGRLARIIANSKAISRRKLALTSEARMSAKIVAAIPVLFFISMRFLSPENYEFVINDPMGRIILYYVIGSEVIGMTIIWLLLKKAT